MYTSSESVWDSNQTFFFIKFITWPFRLFQFINLLLSQHIGDHWGLTVNNVYLHSKIEPSRVFVGLIPPIGKFNWSPMFVFLSLIDWSFLTLRLRDPLWSFFRQYVYWVNEDRTCYLKSLIPDFGNFLTFSIWRGRDM